MNRTSRTVQTNLSKEGKVSIPAAFRAAAGMRESEPLTLSLEGDEIRIRRLRSVLAEIQAEARELFAGSGYTVDKFIEERREEAQREDEGL